MAHMPDDDLKHRLSGGLFFRPDAAAMAIAEKADREFGTAVGKTLAKIQAEIDARGLRSVVRRVCDEGAPVEIIAMLEHMHAHKYQILPDDMMDETRLELWRTQATQFLRASISESESCEAWPMRMNGHATLTRPTQ
jgi:hypothetical protein